MQNLDTLARYFTSVHLGAKQNTITSGSLRKNLFILFGGKYSVLNIRIILSSLDEQIPCT